MNTLRIKKIQEDCEIPTMNPNNTFDIRIHSFHKIDDYTGEIIKQESETYYLQSCKRVLVTTGYTIEYDAYTTIYATKLMNYLEVKTRKQCAIKDGLFVLDYCTHNGELAVLLGLQSDGVILLKKGYRVAIGMITLVHEQ